MSETRNPDPGNPSSNTRSGRSRMPRNSSTDHHGHKYSGPELAGHDWNLHGHHRPKEGAEIYRHD